MGFNAGFRVSLSFRQQCNTNSLRSHHTVPFTCLRIRQPHTKSGKRLKVTCKSESDVEWVPREAIEREAWKEESRKYRSVPSAIVYAPQIYLSS